MTDLQYTITKTCGQCNNKDTYPITKIEAAFDLRDSDIWSTPCTKCGSSQTSGTSKVTPNLDKELLDLWGNNDELYFSSQDEDLILADKNNLDLILSAIDENKYGESQIRLLVYVLLIMISDSTTPSNANGKVYKKQREFHNKVLGETKKRLNIVMKYNLNDSDHFAKVAYPLLGII